MSHDPANGNSYFRLNGDNRNEKKRFGRTVKFRLNVCSLLLAATFFPGIITEHFSQQLKSVVYDFEGFDVGATDLPEGDYSYGDLTYSVAPNPFTAGGQLGDRVLKLDLAWNAGYGAFGRGISRFLELSQQADRFNFYFANPPVNVDSVSVEIIIAEDDNNSSNYETASDDSWRRTVKIPPKSGWQFFSIPLSTLTDDNTGGNGVFDAGFSKGMLLLVELRVSQPTGSSSAATYYTDMLCFSEGILPQGNNAMELPPSGPNDYCLLGAHMQEDPGEFHLIPQHFHSLFPALPNRRIRYVNTYMQWATDGSATPHMLPGNGYKQLLAGGYRPVITWEPMFSGFSGTHAAQPSLDEISSGNYDPYLDAFAAKLKSYPDTIIIRLMHEFDGDWYPWCVANNGGDPQKYIDAFRHIVDRVRQNGVTNVQWMWCPNSDFTPQASWNWVVSAYPGDNYVDIVATDVYNAHYPPGLPWWRSFRWQTAEIYYYLTKYFPSKPFFICENACRERKPGESAASEDKAGWIAAMDRDIQTYFNRTRALVFFSEDKTEQWSVNSSSAALASLRENIWKDDYYFRPFIVGVDERQRAEFQVMPNPATDFVTITHAGSERGYTVTDLAGRIVLRDLNGNSPIDVSWLSRGIYFLHIAGSDSRPKKLLLK